MGRLDGKVAIVSGAARGQGEAEVRLFVAEGARVVLGDVLDERGAAVARSLGEPAVFQHLDVTEPADWAAVVAVAVRRFGRLDVLVNNAGILRVGTIEHMPLDAYRSVIDVNQVGCFLGMQAVIPALRASGGGSIVNTSSVAGIIGVGGIAAYAASKFAVRGMTKVAALELGRDGIRVNSIHPGGIDTDMLHLPELGEVDPASTYDTQPIARIGRPDEVAQLVLFLASDESAYCTGAEFVIDGGFSVGPPIPHLGRR